MSSVPLTSGSADEYRLPTDLKPTHYDITIKTDLEKLRFEGVVKVSLKVQKETTRLVFNSSNLELGNAYLVSKDLSVNHTLTENSVDAVQERVAYQIPTPLPAGAEIDLKIGFKGELTGSMMGYYKSVYEEKGKIKHYALTQFEPTAARRAFPCWDEPLLKATFSVNLISRANTVNLSNMPATSEGPFNVSGAETEADFFSFENKNEDWKITKFEKTPPMSSYIVAFANGEFVHVEKIVKLPLTGKSVPLRVYTTSDVIHQAQFVLDVKADVLPLYEKVFDVAYPLPKLDTLVASDFDAGAMENWGLITGRTSAMLIDPDSADLQSKKNVAMTQSHEVAHMWFGNITTMEWWNYLYLNEGFATLMGEVIIADKVFPEWKVESEFIASHLNRALALDAKPSSHPIEVDCPDANHINQIFDSLSYSKAASVLRMLSNYVGEDVFLKGVSLYLKNKLYGNSVTNDLWEGVSKASGVNVTRLMDNWISKIGFPVLTVTENSDGIVVRQDRFLETGPAESKDNETIWNVPLSILSAGKDGKSAINKSAILEEREKTLKLDTSKPFKLNAGTTGVYRVLYTPDRLAKIASEAIKEGSVFSLNDRIGLVYDALALSRAGFTKLSSSLTLVDIFKNEKEYLVWSGISDSLSDLVSIWWEHPEIVEKLNAFRRSLFAPLVKKFGYDYSASDSTETTLLRTLAVNQAASSGEQSVIKELTDRFAKFMKTGDESGIPADLQRITYRIAVKHGGPEEYDAIIKIYDKPKTPAAHISAILAMCFAKDSDLIQRTLDLVSDKSRDQDMIYFFRALSMNPNTRRILTKYYKDNYDVIYKRFEGNFTLQSLTSNTINFYGTQKDLEETEAFFKDKDTSKYNKALAQSLDSIRARIAYIARSTDDMSDWLVKWQQKESKL